MSSTLKMELDQDVIMIPGPQLPQEVSKMKLRSVEDIYNFFNFFAQRNEPPPCGYIKCINPEFVHGEPFRPYDVVILKRNADSADERALLAQPLRHMVVTATHVAFVRQDGRPEEVMSIKHYIWSSRVFDQLVQLKFFRTFILKRTLLRWRHNISKQRYLQARDSVSKILMLAKATFAKPTMAARQWSFGFSLTQREGEANPARILDVFAAAAGASTTSNSNNNNPNSSVINNNPSDDQHNFNASTRHRHHHTHSTGSHQQHSGGAQAFDPSVAFEAATLLGGHQFPPRLFFFAPTRPLSGIPQTQFSTEQQAHLSSVMQLYRRVHAEIVQIARVVVERVTDDAEMPDVNTYEELEQYLGLQSGIPSESLGPIAQTQRNLERQARKRELKRRLIEYDMLPSWLRLLDQMIQEECFRTLRRSIHFIANHLGLPANGLLRECRHNMHIQLVLDVEHPTTFTPNCDEIIALYANLIDDTIRQISGLPRITEMEEFKHLMYRSYDNKKLRLNVNDDAPVVTYRENLVKNIQHDMVDAEDKGRGFDVCRTTLIWLEVDWIAMRDDWSRRLEGPGKGGNNNNNNNTASSSSPIGSPGSFRVGDGSPTIPNLPTEGEIRQCLSRVSKARSELGKLSSRPIGVVTIHIEPTLQKLGSALDTVVADVRSILLALCSKRVTDITNDIEGNLLTLRAPGLELRHFAEWVERCQKVQASKNSLISHCESLERLFNIADDHFFEVPPTLAEKRERLIGAGKGGFPPLRQQFMDAISKAASHMENNVNAVKNQLNNEIQNTTALIDSLKNNLVTGECRKSGHVATVMVQKLDGINHTLKTAASTRQTLDHYCKLLEVDAPEWNELKEAQEAYKRRNEVWTTKAKWEERKSYWQKTPVGQLNGELLKENMIELFQKAHKMNRVDGDTATDDLLNDISAEKVNLPVIVELCNSALSEEHWYKISEGINKKLPPPETRTLDSLKTLGAYAHFETISEISAVATGEWSVANQVKKVSDAWEDTPFVLAKPKQASQKGGEELYILGGLDDVFQQIDEHQVQIQTCMASRYVDGVRRQVEEWDTKLKLFYDCIQEWVSVQRSWLYLEFIFSSDDIKKQLPDESRLFSQVDKTFRTLMHQTVQNNNVQAICTQPGLLDLLKQATYNLERIQKHLEEYLETKRIAFPRFYFLSNDELLSILSDVRNATAVQPHLQKCFDAIKSLEFEPDNITVKAMVSPEGEVVPFSSKVRAVGNAETWLGEIEKMMRQTLFDNTQEARRVYPEQVREEWIFRFPSQCIQCVDQIIWTRETEQVWKEIDDATLPHERRDNHPLVRYRDRYKQQIMRLVGLVKTNLSKLNRTCTCTLIVLGVHNRDVLSSLADAGVTSGDDFEWSKQMRYYWIEKGGVDDNSSIPSATPNCYIHHADAKISYGYEYLGNGLRLVITPLTERAFMTCTGALRLCQGAAPQGPAGTGKTESVKDLGKALARQVVVFNCFTGDTPITLEDGTSIPLQEFGEMFNNEEEQNEILPHVLSAFTQQDQQMGISAAPCVRFIRQPRKRNVVELTFADGRSVKCTPEHRFLMADGSWVEAQDLPLREEKSVESAPSASNCVRMGVSGTLRMPVSKMSPADLAWTLEFSSASSFAPLKMNSYAERERTFRFARIAGFVFAQQQQQEISFTSERDCNDFVRDVELLGGKCTRQNNNTVSLQDSALLDAITSLSRMTNSWPQFTCFCPIVVLREFLAGVFGGDMNVEAPTLANETSSFFTPIKITQTVSSQFKQSATQQMSALCSLLDRAGCPGFIVNNSSAESKICDISIEARSSLLNTSMFMDKIGVRYSQAKLHRFSVAASFSRYVQKKTEEEVSSRRCSTPAPRRTREEETAPVEESEILRLPSDNCLDARQFCIQTGCLSFFTNKNENKQNHFDMCLELLNRTELAEKETVFDITVDNNMQDGGNFLVNGLVAHNCSDGINYKIMSRMFAGLAQAGAWACFDEFNRIPIEVLSVVAQQMLEITTAIAAKLDTIFFDGAHNIKLNRNFGVFITMNPGYAGRTELPDNLKALFRPICMMIPDYALIAEIMFFSEGFAEARSLAQKMVRLYSLASQQLSKQDHYDFGMRAVKSILVVAGALKRAAADDVPEDVTLIRAMREANIPKFLRDDTKLFLALIKDLFPSVIIAEVENEMLIKGISHSMITQKLQPVPTFITKVVQLFETMLVRHGVMLVGQTLTGKTACELSLTGALTHLHHKRESRGGKDPHHSQSQSKSARGAGGRRRSSVGAFATSQNPGGRRASTLSVQPDDEENKNNDPPSRERSTLGDDLQPNESTTSHPVAPISARSNRSTRSAATAEELIRDHDHIDDELFDLVPESHLRFYQPSHIVRINPKSISMGELYGDVNPLTREWHDGILSHIVRELVKNTTHDRHWVLFDGPVDAIWIENMNTVLDDNKLLCLVNGERIKVPDTITTTFEVQDLKVASPATVSRCGMVFMEGYYLEGGWKPIAKSLCEKYAEEDKARREAKEREKLAASQAQAPAGTTNPANPAAKADALAQKERDALIPKPAWHADWAMETIQKLVPATLTFIREQCKELIPSADAQLVQSMIHLLQAMHVAHINDMQSRKANLTPQEWRVMLEEEDGDRVETSDPLKAKVPLSVSGYDERRTFNMLSVFAYFWSFGANLAETSRTAFSNFARDLISRNMYVNLPSEGDVMNYFVHRGSMSWVPWSYRTPKFVYDPNGSFYDAFVPTPETVRLHSVIATLCLNNRNVLVSGVTGTGKSTGIKTVLYEKLNTEDIHSKFQAFAMTFSAQTTSEEVQETLETKLQRRRGDKEMGPPPGKTMVFVIDDCNMPALETYGASPPIELLRQLISQGGAFNRKKLFFRDFVDCLFVASCGEPGGSRSELTQRFTSRFHCINVPSLGNDSMMVIFKSILNGHFTAGKFDGTVASLAESLVTATISIYRQIVKDMLPTPEKSHYTFNLRDVSKVVQGLVQVPSQYLSTPEEAIILWVHEATRVFADRLTNVDDLEWWNRAVTDVAKNAFPSSTLDGILDKPAMTTASASQQPSRAMSPTSDLGANENDSNKDNASKPTSPTPPAGDTSPAPSSTGWGTGQLEEPYSVIPCNDYLFGSWADKKHAEYVRITDADMMQHMLEEHQMDFKAQFMREEDLVLFKDAAMHVARMCRILRLPRGNMLLVGVGGSGRRSLCALASHIMIMDLKTISIFRNYGPNDFREDVKKILLECGTHQKPVVFELADSQLVHNAFLNDLNSLLNIGEVPGLMGPEELDRIMVACRDQVRNEGKPETRSVLYQCFVNRCQENLHIVLCMSPVGSVFRDNVRKFPSLVNCMSIDWFFPWPEEALKSVADRVLNKLKLDKSEEHLREPVAKLAVNVHTSVKAVSEQMFNKLRRRNDTTPTSYLTLLSLISETLADQVSQNENNANRYRLGLEKLSEVSKDVDVLQQRIKDAQPALEQAAKDVEEKTKIIAAEKEEADKVRSEVADEEAKAREMMADAEQLKTQCDAALAEAMPVLDAAVKALEVLSKKDIDEIRTFTKPPRLVEKTLNAVLIMLKEDEGWSVAKSVLQGGNFLNRLIEYPKENIPDRVIRKVKPFIQDEEFVPDKIGTVSLPCKSMCMWTHAIYKFHFVYKEVVPLKEKLDIAEAKVAHARTVLEEKQQMLRDVERKVALLEDQLRDTAEKQAQLQAQITEAERKLQRADALIVGMRDEKKRWISSLASLEKERGTLVGFSTLAASSIAYLGAFTAEYRADLVSRWVKICQDLEIPMNAEKSTFTPSDIADAHTARSWNSLGLPSDEFSIENAVILTRSKRAGLLIDPESQGGSFIKNLEKKNKIKIVKASDENYMRVVEAAVQVGVPVLMENCGEELDAALNPVLLRQTVRVGGRNVLKLGDKEVDFDPRFKLYLTTKLANPVFSPELQVKVTVINFSVTRKGLEDQLLADIVATERKELQEKSDQCVMAIAEGKDNIRKLELQILKMLAEATGDILDNLELISTLQQSKRTADTIGRDLAAVEKANVEITAAREEYRVLAVQGSLIYRAISDLAGLDAMYQNSLQFFKTLFLSVIERVQLVPSESVAERVQRLLPAVTKTSFAVICRGLFEKDKALFAFILANGIMKHDGKIKDSEMLVFLRGAAGKVAPMGFPLVPDFLTTNIWNEYAAVATAVPEIDESCTMKIRTDEDKKWSNWMMSDDVMSLPEGPARKLSAWHQLLVAHALRPETTTRFMSRVVGRELGESFTSSPAFSLRDVYDDSSSTTPLVFILSEGSDPTKLFTTFAEEMGFADKKLMLSLGQDQGGRAESYIEQGKSEGLWVYLQNCHVYTSWMPSLERIVEGLKSSAGGGGGGDSSSGGGAQSIHPHFRLWLSSKPAAEFPVLVLQSGMKITREPPTGIRGKLKDTLVSGLGDSEWSAFTWKPPHVAQGQKPPPPPPVRDQAFDVAREFIWKRLVFALMFAHASILERRKYGAIGWNIPYQWGTPDLAAALKVIRVGMEAIPRTSFTKPDENGEVDAKDEFEDLDMTDKDAVAIVVDKLATDAKKLIADHLNWPAMDFTCCDLHFGGRVTDFLDGRCLGTMLRKSFGKEILAEGFTFDDGESVFIFPSDSDDGSWRAKIDSLQNVASGTSSPKTTNVEAPKSEEQQSPLDDASDEQKQQQEKEAAAAAEKAKQEQEEKEQQGESPKVYRPTSDFSPTEKVQAPNMDEILNFISDLPAATSPNLLGLHSNAAITFWMKECNASMAQLVSIQPREGGGEGKSVKEIVLEVAAEILKGLPEPIDKSKAHSSTFATLADDTVNSLGTFLGQEIDQYNNLRNLIKSTLTTVIRAIKGEVLMNEAAEKVFDALAFNRVPEIWRTRGYLTLKPLASYVKDFQERFTFMRRWCQVGPPPSFWLSGMFFPQGFVTAVLQAHSRKFTMAIDSIILRFNMMDEAQKNAPKTGVFVHGLFLEGAGWDKDKQCITEPKPRATTCGLPTVHFEPHSIALEKGQQASAASKKNSNPDEKKVVPLRPSATVPSYSCPLYKAGSRTGVLSTTGVSTNYVLNLELPLPVLDEKTSKTKSSSLSSTPAEEKHWILRGAAALCALDD